jgi:hypothetical protein
MLGTVDALIETKKDEADRIYTEVEEMRDGPNGAKTCSRLKVVELGRDDNGDPITSCVIVEDETANDQSPRQKSNSKPPSPLAQKFYAAFANAAADLAKHRQESSNRPSITEDQWIRQLEQVKLVEKVLMGDVNKADYRKAYNTRSALISKYRRELIAVGWICCNGEFIWSTREGSWS